MGGLTWNWAISGVGSAPRASDIFLKEGVPPSLRLHGRVAPTDCPVLSGDDVRQLAYSIMTPQQIARFEQRHELDLAFTREGLARFRANCYLQKGSMGMVLRLIPLTCRIWTNWECRPC